MSIIKGHGMALVISPVKVATPQHRTPPILRNVGESEPSLAKLRRTSLFSWPLPTRLLRSSPGAFLIASQRLFDFPEPEEVCSSDKLVTVSIREVEPVRGFYTPRLIRTS